MCPVVNVDKSLEGLQHGGVDVERSKGACGVDVTYTAGRARRKPSLQQTWRFNEGRVTSEPERSWTTKVQN